MNVIVDEACVLSIVFTGTPRRVLRKENSLDIPPSSADLTIQSHDSMLLGGASVTNGLEFEPAWLSEPSEPVSRMQKTKRRIEQFSVHTSCSVALLHVDVGARLKKSSMSARMTRVNPTSVPVATTFFRDDSLATCAYLRLLMTGQCYTLAFSEVSSLGTELFLRYVRLSPRLPV